MRVVGVIALAALLGAPLRAQDTTATRDSLPSSGVIDTAAFRDLAVPDPRQLRTLQPRVVEPASWSVVIDSARFHDLPSTDPRQVIDLQRGVMETGSPKGVSLRGSAPGEAATYIDGALIRNGQRGEADLVLGANAIRQAWLTTGGLAADVGDAASGAISFLTRTGSERWRGSLHYRTDDVAFDAWGNVGLHRVEASVGGPVRGGLTLFTAVTLNGQQSLDTEKNRDVQAPVYVVGGIDTIVHQPERWGVDPTDSAFVAIPRFVQYGGGCDAAGNDGLDCQGLRVPLTANGSLAWQGRIQESYGRGSLVGLTGLASRAQQRDYPGVSLYNPSNYTGTSAANTAAILNWRQVLGPWTERAPILSVNVSYQRDTRISGPLTRQAELDSRSPFGGFLLKPLDYVVNPNSTYSVRIQDSVYADVRYLDDRQLQCVQAGEGACRHPVAYLNDNALNSVMPYRMNPYGVEQSTSFPLWTAGADNGLDLSREARWQGRAELAWQVGAFNRIRLGAEHRVFDTRRYSDPSGMNSSFGLDAYHERPIERGAYLEDRLDVGGAAIVVGVRYDHYDSRANFPFTPGRIASFPQLPSDSVCAPSGACAVVPGAATPFDPYRPTARYLRAPSHAAWSPRVQASFRATATTQLRLSYSEQVQVPDFDIVFAHKNTDLSTANRGTTIFGRDLDFTRTAITEAGVRQHLGDHLTLDVAAYLKRRPSDVVVRFVSLTDPALPFSMRNVYGVGDFWVYANGHLEDLRGLDATLEGRLSTVVAGAVAYTYQTSSSPDPVARHSLGGWVTLTPSKGVFANTSASAIVRLTSGTPYNRFLSPGSGWTLTNTACLGGCAASAPSTLPWFKTVDVRLRRGFTIRGVGGFAFVESTNLLNFTNVKDLFVGVGDVVDGAYERRYTTEQKLLLAREAANAQILKPDSSVDFNALGGCANWQGSNNAGFASGPVDCVLLERAERRFGNGDGVFTPSEYGAAFDAWYALANAPYRFYGPGRRIRVGAELSF